MTTSGCVFSELETICSRDNFLQVPKAKDILLGDNTVLLKSVWCGGECIKNS